jgi:hypothetical protein
MNVAESAFIARTKVLKAKRKNLKRLEKEYAVAQQRLAELTEQLKREQTEYDAFKGANAAIREFLTEVMDEELPRQPQPQYFTRSRKNSTDKIFLCKCGGALDLAASSSSVERGYCHGCSKHYSKTLKYTSCLSCDNTYCSYCLKN